MPPQDSQLETRVKWLFLLLDDPLPDVLERNPISQAGKVILLPFDIPFHSCQTDMLQRQRAITALSPSWDHCWPPWLGGSSLLHFAQWFAPKLKGFLIWLQDQIPTLYRDVVTLHSLRKVALINWLLEILLICILYRIKSDILGRQLSMDH